MRNDVANDGKGQITIGANKPLGTYHVTVQDYNSRKSGLRSQEFEVVASSTAQTVERSQMFASVIEGVRNMLAGVGSLLLGVR